MVRDDRKKRYSSTPFLFIATIGVLTVCFLEKTKPYLPYAKVFYNLGLEAEGKKDFSRALYDYRQSLRYDPGFPYTYYRIGLISFRKSDFVKAAEYFWKSVGLDPSFNEGFDGLGLCYLEQGNYQRAIACFKKAVRVDNPFFRYHLGLAYAKGGYKDNAVDVAAELRRKGASNFADQLETSIKSLYN